MPAMDIEADLHDVLPDHDAEDAEEHAGETRPISDTVLRTRRRSSVAKPKPNPKKGQQKQRQRQKHTEDGLVAAVATETESAESARAPEQMTAVARPLLVCSIGNPGGQYANTLHSAGHTVLSRLALQLGYPAFRKGKTWGNGLVSRPPSLGDSGNWSLWQSTAYMNESGKGVREAFNTWNRTLPDGHGRLIVVHDELEKPLGAVNVKTQQGLSARGHNGLKSILASLGNTPFIRIGIGIGRPVSRDRDDVSRYVLQKMDQGQLMTVERSVDEVIEQLRKLERG